MKGVLLASHASVGIFCGMTVVFRFWPTRSRVVLAFKVYVASVGLLVFLYVVTPRDLGFLPEGLLGSPSWLDFVFSLFALSASFFGGWLQLYNLANRGYSLRVLIDLLRLPYRAATPGELVTAYADGRGLVWMYDIRLEGLREGSFIAEADGRVSLTERGRRAARISRFLRSVYRLGMR